MITHTKVQLKALRKVARLSKGKGYASEIELTPRDMPYISELMDLKLIRDVPLYEPEYQHRYTLTDLGSKELVDPDQSVTY